MKDFFDRIPKMDRLKSTLGDRISKIDPNKISNVSGFYQIVENFSQLSPERQQELIAIAEFLIKQENLNKRDKQKWEQWREVRKLYRDLLIEIKTIKS